MRDVIGGIVLGFACVMAFSAQATGSFDGVYEGSGAAMGGKCAPSTHPVFRVADNHISAKWGGTATVDADVAPDGTLKNGPAAIATTTSGSISGKTLTMDVTGQRCSMRYTLDKRS